ncbi:MAG: dihydropteroate synthase [Succinatimonas hippei]|nr:dihydropteroate synthase [Succinatimonas hippei]
MKLELSGRSFSLDVTRIIGMIPVIENDDRPVEDYIKQARKLTSDGADFLEIGMRPASEAMVSERVELEKLVPVVRAVADETGALVAICTSYPSVMKAGNDAGACMIVDPNALRVSGALQMAAKLDIPVILCDPGNDSEVTDDPVSVLQEFFYERVDACLNAGISRKRLIIDPMMGNPTRVDAALKMLGRIHTFKSFALPLSVAIPKALPYMQLSSDENDVVSLTLALFVSHSGVRLIRTTDVSRTAMALASWQIASQTARPHQLSKGVVRRLIAIRDRLRIRLSAKRKNQ